MRIRIPIGKLVEHASEFYKTALNNNEEIKIDGVSIDTPSGEFPITHIIKKYDLPMLKLTFDNGYELECAEKHILSKDGNDIFAIDLRIGDSVAHRTGDIKLVNIESINNTDCYDISVPSPHLYYDANGLVHHNTITTATLSHLCEPYGKTIVIVPSKSLVEQTEEDYLNCGLDVGVYYGNRKDLYKTHTICTWQSLNVLDKKSKNDEQEVITLTEFLEGVSAVIADEVHTVTGAILTKLLTQNLGNAPIRWGLTGTIPKDAYAFESIFTSIGPVIGSGVRAKELQDRGVLSKCHVNVVQMLDVLAFKNYADELRYLVTNVDRVQYIGNMIRTISESGNTLVLVDRIQTGKMLVEMLEGAVFISGEVKVKDRKTELDEVKTVDNKIIVASFGTMSTGVSVNRIFNLVLLEAGKSFTRVIQSIGRGVRTAPDKDFVQIWDITSTCKYAKRHLTERKRFYKEAEYPFTIEKVDWNK
jgi:superfamily II DNA or RNA helicase